MLEDLFKLVKTRFNDEEADKEEPPKKSDIPSGLMFKCPRCGGVCFEEEFEKLNKVLQSIPKNK